MRCDMEVTNFWHRRGVMDDQVAALLGPVSVIVLYRTQVRSVFWPVDHRNIMVPEPAFGTKGSVSRSQLQMKNETCNSMNLVIRGK